MYLPRPLGVLKHMLVRFCCCVTVRRQSLNTMTSLGNAGKTDALIVKRSTPASSLHRSLPESDVTAAGFMSNVISWMICSLRYYVLFHMPLLILYHGSIEITRST